MADNDRSEGGLRSRLSGIGKWILAAAFLAAPLTTLRPGGGPAYGDFFLALAFVLALMLVVARRRLPVVPALVWAGSGLLVISIVTVVLFAPESVEALVSSFSSTPPAYDSSWSPGMRLLVSLVALPLAASIIVDRWSTVGVLANAWLIGVLVSCAVAFLDASIGLSIQTSVANDPQDVAWWLSIEPARHLGLTAHPNSLGSTAALATPILLVQMTDWRRVILGVPVFILLLFGILLSGSRGALLGIILATILTLAIDSPVRRAIYSRSRKLKVSLALAAGLVATLTLLFVVSTQFDRSDPDGGGGVAALDRLGGSAYGVQESNDTRLQYAEDSVKYIAERPVPGWGFQWIETSHNLYFQLLLSGGVLALLGFLLVILGYLRTGMKVRSGVPEALQRIRLGLLVSLVVFLAMGLYTPDLLDRYLYLPAALILAMSALATSSGFSGRRRTAQPHDSILRPVPSQLAR